MDSSVDASPFVSSLNRSMLHPLPKGKHILQNGSITFSNDITNIPTTTSTSCPRNHNTVNGSSSENRNRRFQFVKLRSGKHFIQNELISSDFSAQDPRRIEELPNNQSTFYHEGYWDIGDPTYECQFCGALFWYDERVRKERRTENPSFSKCCMNGQVQLPLLKDPPMKLKNLLSNKDSKSRLYQENIRPLNMMFAFTSMGGKIDSSVNQGRGPYVFKLHGQNYHRIGSLLPNTGDKPKFSQLYIYDTDNEINNRISSLRSREQNSKSTQDSFDIKLLEDLKAMLDENNPLVKAFRFARDRLNVHDCPRAHLRLIGSREKDGRTYNMPTASEVAALIVGDIDNSFDKRDIIIETIGGAFQRISELHPAYLALQYPLLFPYGEDGYRIDIELRQTGSSKKRSRVSMREFFAYRIRDRLNEAATLLLSRKLFQQFLVDAYTMIESERLFYIRSNQKSLRSDAYNNIHQAANMRNTNTSSVGKRIILPSSFTGGARYMIQNYLDAMALCRWYGYPDLFITFTCNPKWPEITRFVKNQGLKPEDRPDIICRVFKIKLDQLIKDLRENKIFGRVQAVVYTVEFQKRGLPHAHILLFMHPDNKFPTAEDIDKIISAEIPDKTTHQTLYEVVSECMVHGPCGLSNKKSPCMKNGKCSKHFPKKFVNRTTIDAEGYPIYRRCDDGHLILKSGVPLDNRFVVPYNAQLLMKYRAHINVEWCNQHRSIKYLFKYINKGYDRVTAALSHNDGSNDNDEIQMYYDCRYISPCEAVWRIFGFDIHYRIPAVERLGFHLPGEQSIVFDESDSFDNVLNRPGIENSMFTSWMECNKIYADAKDITYAEFPTKFVWKQDQKIWSRRKKGFSIGRIHFVPPSCGEGFYLRTLLNKVAGPTSYEDIRTVDGVVYPTYKEACYAMGLMDDDKEYIEGILEASIWGSGSFLRSLFAMLLISNSLSRPEFVWEKTWHILSEDILYKQRNILQIQDLQLPDDQLKNYALIEIENILRRNACTLRRYDTMPFPNYGVICEGHNRLLHEELNYDKVTLSVEHKKLLSCLTDEQKSVYEKIMGALSRGKGGVFFLYGYGGTGKTFVWRTLATSIRSRGEIVLNVASSGIASLLLSGGRTAHSRFTIPININEDSICSIKHGSDLAVLLERAKLIIWDEAPMIHKFCFEALDRTLRDILRQSNSNSLHQPFGGKVIVFGGDFRQILPVIPKGNRQDIVSSAINSSYLWNHCEVLRLTKNMRLQVGITSQNIQETKDFAEWILKIGDGKVGESNDGETDFQIPNDILIKDESDPVGSIIRSTYPSLVDNLWDSSYFQQRAILAPTHDAVDTINEELLSVVPGEEKVYLSSDSICSSDKANHIDNSMYSPEYLNSIRISGLPNHKLKLKVGVPVMLLRNIDQPSGLCNGTRLQVCRLGNHVIEAQIISGNNAGQKVFIPRILICPSDARLPFKMQRRQFPLDVCFAMTINKSQGQSLSRVGLYLPRSCFTHGQLYVAVSRVTQKEGLKILICDKEGNTSNVTKNVVYKEVFRNL